MVNFGTMVIGGDCDTIKSCGKSNGDYSTGTTTAPGRTLDNGAVDNSTLCITKKDRSRDKKSPPKADKKPAFLNRPLAFGDHKSKSAKKDPPPLTPQEQLKALGIVELKARQGALSREEQAELSELHDKYNAKRLPIEQALDRKKGGGL